MVSFKNFFLFLFCFAASGKLADAAPDNVDQRVVGGTDAAEGEFPYTVELIFNYDENFPYDYCTGTLIAPDVVLTAASCLSSGPPDSNLTAVVGHTLFYSESIDYPYTVRNCAETVLHPEADTQSNRFNDVALCILDEPIAINETSTYLELNTDYKPEHEEPLTLVGWGLMGFTPTQIGWNIINIAGNGFFPPFLAQFEPVFLQKSENQPFLGNERCQTAEDMAALIIGVSGGSNIDATIEIQEGIMCTWDKKGQTSRGAKNLFGDTGSPLLKITEDADGRLKHTQMGITSTAFVPGITPTVYMDVAYFYDWITSTACDDYDSVADFCECKSGKSGKSCKSTKSGKSSKKKSSKKIKSKKSSKA